jgi:hypothetical protein
VGRRLRCKSCNDVIESKYTHDFVSCKCGMIFVDGGNEYTRYGYLKEHTEEQIEFVDE